MFLEARTRRSHSRLCTRGNTVLPSPGPADLTRPDLGRSRGPVPEAVAGWQRASSVVSRWPVRPGPVAGEGSGGLKDLFQKNGVSYCINKLTTSKAGKSKNKWWKQMMKLALNELTLTSNIKMMTPCKRGKPLHVPRCWMVQCPRDPAAPPALRASSHFNHTTTGTCGECPRPCSQAPTLP